MAGNNGAGREIRSFKRGQLATDCPKLRLLKKKGVFMNYVMHICRNKKCNNGWVDKDLTDARINPPDWKYCKDCAEKLGIDYDAQTPDSNLTEKELAHKNKLRERLKIARLAQQKINSADTETG